MLVSAPAVYVTVSDRTCIIRRYHMHGNPMRIYILLGITRTSLNNAKVRCERKDEYVYKSYAHNTTPVPHRSSPLRLERIRILFVNNYISFGGLCSKFRLHLSKGNIIPFFTLLYRISKFFIIINLLK